MIEARQALAPAAAPPDEESLLREPIEELTKAMFPIPEEDRETLDEELRPLVESETD